MKTILVISTGRCGNHRIAQILQEKLNGYTVTNKLRYSRIAYVIGNMMYHFGEWQWLKKKIYNFMIKPVKKGKGLVNIDGRSNMVVPDEVILQKDILVLHIEREAKSFSKSMFKFSRANLTNLLAHNFVPFWQLNLLPLENLLNKNVLKRYEKLSVIKNKFFREKFSKNPNYTYVRFEEVFKDNILSDIVNSFFNENININEDELNKKAKFEMYEKQQKVKAGY